MYFQSVISAEDDGHLPKELKAEVTSLRPSSVSVRTGGGGGAGSGGRFLTLHKRRKKKPPTRSMMTQTSDHQALLDDIYLGPTRVNFKFDHSSLSCLYIFWWKLSENHSDSKVDFIHFDFQFSYSIWEKKVALCKYNET